MVPLTMTLTRRLFLRAAATTVAALALPLTSTPTSAAPCPPGQGTGSGDACADPAATTRAPGDPSFEPFWVATHLPTKLWPTADEVADQTMDSRTIPGLADHYLLKDVLFTQYFTGDGAAIHYNWWGPPRGFGYPGSHGCLGMRYDGSKFMWDWAGVGTPIVIHF